MTTLIPLYDPKVFRAALYFMDGQYLFRYQDKAGGLVSKYVKADDLVAAFTLQESDSGWLPAGVVRSGTCKSGSWYVYSAPAQRVEITIDPDEKLSIPIPRTVLLGTEKGHYLWAIKSKYFDPDEDAYHAPFPNINPNGKICWGNSKPRKLTAQYARETWDLFFASLFNADLTTDKSKKNDHDVSEVLREVSKSGLKKYPESDLVPAGGSIGQVVDRTLRGL